MNTLSNAAQFLKLGIKEFGMLFICTNTLLIIYFVKKILWDLNIFTRHYWVCCMSCKHTN